MLEKARTASERDAYLRNVVAPGACGLPRRGVPDDPVEDVWDAPVGICPRAAPPRVAPSVVRPRALDGTGPPGARSRRVAAAPRVPHGYSAGTGRGGAAGAARIFQSGRSQGRGAAAPPRVSDAGKLALTSTGAPRGPSASDDASTPSPWTPFSS